MNLDKENLSTSILRNNGPIKSALVSAAPRRKALGILNRIENPPPTPTTPFQLPLKEIDFSAVKELKKSSIEKIVENRGQDDIVENVEIEEIVEHVGLKKIQEIVENVGQEEIVVGNSGLNEIVAHLGCEDLDQDVIVENVGQEVIVECEANFFQFPVEKRSSINDIENMPFADDHFDDDYPDVVPKSERLTREDVLSFLVWEPSEPEHFPAPSPIAEGDYLVPVLEPELPQLDELSPFCEWSDLENLSLNDMKPLPVEDSPFMDLDDLSDDSFDLTPYI